jgi:hypothetical protein
VVKILWGAAFAIILISAPRYAAGQVPSGAIGTSPDAPTTDDLVGTVIATQNWQKYREYMPDGMAALFEGKYFWKMPPDAEMEIGPTVVHPLPKAYVDATEKYSSQVRIVELLEGRLTLSNYQGGVPFPDPMEPHRGWKILANLWFRYLPHLSVDTNGVVCTMDSNRSVSCKAGMKVYRQLAFNTDPGIPAHIPEPRANTSLSMKWSRNPSRNATQPFLLPPTPI